MKIAVYDPLKAFTPFVNYLGMSHEVTYIDIPVALDELRYQHIVNDIVWYEFCDDVFRRAVTHPKECVIVNRLHSYELFTDVPGTVDWEKVDILVASSDEVKALLEKKRDVISFPPISVLANGPDLEQIKMPAEKTYGKRIAMIGNINYKKNYPLAIYCMDAIRGEGYELHVFGQSQDLRFDFYLKHLVKELELEDCVFFHGGVPHDELMQIMQGMDYILSTSLYESFGQGIMEGVASGCLPMIHNFPGAQERFGGLFSCLFDVPKSCANGFRWYSAMSDNTRRLIASGNRMAIEKYSLDKQYVALDNILAEAMAAVNA